MTWMKRSGSLVSRQAEASIQIKELPRNGSFIHSPDRKYFCLRFEDGPLTVQAYVADLPARQTYLPKSSSPWPWINLLLANGCSVMAGLLPACAFNLRSY